jgi:hypothetical protein
MNTHLLIGHKTAETKAVNHWEFMNLNSNR